MNGIASFLDPYSSTRVEAFWKQLESRCGLVGVKTTPFPHFSWQVTEGYDLDRLDSTLREISRQTQPFTIRTAGLGIFTGEKPVVYVTIVKEASLTRFHSLLWEQLNGISIGPSRFYAPDQWVPHITIAYNDVHTDNLICALQALAFQSFDWEINIDNLVYLTQNNKQVIDTIRYQLRSPA